MTYFQTVKKVVSLSVFASITFVQVGVLRGQDTVSFSDYFPADPEIYCKKTFEWTFG